jgi:hypothetical protein
LLHTWQSTGTAAPLDGIACARAKDRSSIHICAVHSQGQKAKYNHLQMEWMQMDLQNEHLIQILTDGLTDVVLAV